MAENPRFTNNLKILQKSFFVVLTFTVTTMLVLQVTSPSVYFTNAFNYYVSLHNQWSTASSRELTSVSEIVKLKFHDNSIESPFLYQSRISV